MALKTSVSITLNRFPELARKLPKAVDTVCRKTATDIQAGATVRTTRVDTGAMRGGYVVEQVGLHTWIIYNTQFYQIYHELGTVHITALGMLVPAAEQNRAPFLAAMGHLEGMLA